ncbi:MAG: C1 family peptidase [Anaerolineae bacterium]
MPVKTKAPEKEKIVPQLAPTEEIGVVTFDGRDYILNCLRMKDFEKDWRITHAMAAGIVPTLTDAIPATVDLRAPWWQVFDQGQHGSCVGCACADSVVRWHLVKANKLDQRTLLSVRFVWMASKELDTYTNYATTFIELDGTFLKAALDVVRKFGVVPADWLPYDPEKLYHGALGTFYGKAAQYKIGSYYNLGTNLNDWKMWLASHGPILTRLNVDDTWMNAKATHGNLDVYHPAAVYGGHAVALVGYTADRFIVRNSWGTNWGDQGFAYASMKYAQEAFTEAYGIVV